ncbi:MAG: helicase-related protein [Acidimicrobiales bacterium]
MPGRPYLLDNLGDETTHAGALGYLLGDIGTSHPLAVATGYVNLAGLHHLATLVQAGRPTRLLLGAAPDPGLGADFPISRFERALRSLAADRDLARFPPSRAAAHLSHLAAWLAEPSVEVRRYVTRFLHGKAYLFGTTADARAALVTSANLTGAGLFANLELGLAHYDPPVAGAALKWFERLWADAADYKEALQALLFPDPGLVEPETVYLRALLELYGDDLEAPLPPSTISAVALAGFQRDGYEQALRIVAQHHGVIYADGVGTGKTEIGLAFIEEYALHRGHHALVVAPAQLVANWTERIDAARLPAQVVSYQQLAGDEQLAPDAAHRRRHLHAGRDTYRLVVVDEAHALRNPDTTWRRALERLLGGERKDLVLLTATPINNGLWDLYHLVMAFARHDRAFAPIGIDSARDLFVRAGASERDPGNLDPDVLFPLADAVSVRRDRRFIEDRYPGATFPDGTPVRFPTPVLVTARYDLDQAHPGLVPDITASIGGLTMARYRPSAWEIGAEEEAAEAALGGLLQSGVLKRFESCWAACLSTVSRMLAAHDAFIAAWDDHGVVASRAALRAAALAEVDDAGLASWVAEEVAGDAGSRPSGEFRPDYRDAVAADREVLSRIRDRLAGLDADSDPKLVLLRRLLEGSPSAKVAVFAGFGDTVDYLDRHLAPGFAGRERVVVIGSASDPDSRAAALARFSPKTVVRPDYVPADGEVDLLLSTDILSEGQNLQQAGAVISYDMPWNPQRVVQRNGRVIRLKSDHDTVRLTTMLPEPGALEEILRLEATILRKIFAASVYGMESGVIEGVEVELRSYAARLAAGDETLLDDDGDAGQGGAFSGEDLRAVVLRAISEGETQRLRGLPWGIGAAFRQGPSGPLSGRQAPGVPSTGTPGLFFACRTRGGERYWRYVEADGPDTDIRVTDVESEMLRRINPGSAPGVSLSDGGVNLEDAWQAAVADIVAAHNRRGDPRYAQERIGPAQRFAVDLLRDPTVTLPVGAAAAEEALSVERSSSVRQALSEVRARLVDATISADRAAQDIVAVVDSYGLQPVEAPPLLEPITEDDLGVVCWMAVLPATRTPDPPAGTTKASVASLTEF